MEWVAGLGDAVPVAQVEAEDGQVEGQPGGRAHLRPCVRALEVQSPCAEA